MNGDADATSPAINDWVGFATSVASADTRFDHCQISYAGRSQNAAIYAGGGFVALENSSIHFSDTRALYVIAGDVVLRNNTISDATFTGLWLRNYNGFAIMQDNHFENCGTGVYGFEPGVQLEASGTTATNCGTTNAIKVTGNNTTIQDDQVWQEELLYDLTIDLTLSAGVSWTLAPGTRIKVELDKQITINGELSAIGTADAPIQFTSFLDDSIGGDTNEDADASVPAPGDWKGIVVQNGATVNFDYVEMYYGGAGTTGTSASLRFASGYTTFDIANSTFAYSEWQGIHLGGYPAGRISGNTIRDLAGYGIYSNVNNTGQSMAQPFMFPSQQEYILPDWNPENQVDLCKGWKAGFTISQTIVEWPFEVFPGAEVPIPKILDELFGANSVKITVLGNGEANLVKGRAALGAEMELKFFYDSKTGEGLFVKGKGIAGMAWSRNSATCNYEFDNLFLGIGVTGRSRIPIPWPSVNLGPLLEARVGIQVDLVIGADLEWDRPRILPTGGKLKASGGLGGYVVGKALGGVLKVGGSVVGYVNLEAGGGTFGFKDITIKASISGEIDGLGLKEEKTVQFTFVDGKITSSEGLFDGGDGFAPLSVPGLEPIVNMAADGSLDREFMNAKGWAVKETYTKQAPTGTSNSYVLPGISQSILSDVSADLVGEGRPELFLTETGNVGAIWSRNPEIGSMAFNSRIMYAEYDGSNWSVPSSIAEFTGINRSLKLIKDANDQLLVVFSHSAMNGLDKDSPVDELLSAYEDSDLCFIRQTGTGWSQPQALDVLPGIASDLSLHRLPDGTVYATWSESSMNKGSLFVKKWDPENLLWLPSQKLSGSNPQSNASIGIVGADTIAIWGELVNYGDGNSFNEIGERFVYSTLTNGVWSEPTEMDLPFSLFPDDPVSEESAFEGNGFTLNNQIPSPPIQTQSFDASSFFDLNTYVDPPSGCCDSPSEDAPALLTRIVDKAATLLAEACGKNNVSGDPNDKYGMYGYGPDGWITENNTIPYTVTYENDVEAGATAPAQRVRIFDQLDSDFDFDSFAFRSFGWADYIQEIPENTQNFETMVNYHNSDGTPLIVKVKGSFNRATGEIEMLYDSIDPDTGFSPYGAFDGFLPVEDGTGIGQGFVRYDIKQKPNLPQGTKFINKADIYFDLNEVIETPTAVHTIDLEKPTSSASSPATSDSNTFTVSLTGSDPDGSGIAYFKVYKSVDGGPWSVWLGSSADPNPSFTGEVGRSYSFYSIAVDNVGLSEEKEPHVETTTKITGSDLSIESVLMLTEDTVRVVLKVPEGLGAGVSAETADLLTPYEWDDLPGITFTLLEDGRIEVIVPFTEQTRQFFRFIISDQPAE